MKHVKILGTGCRNCQATLNLVEEVARAQGVEIRLEKVDQIQDIMRYPIMATPGVVIDEVVVHSGGVPDRKTVEGWFAPSA
ncbi:thioredoxin family protein [Thermochromatium tepidum]|uniref:Thioredoxin family protein n=1 Tax=Thermochromatium tepidum ATCC 43061 TaxID=316276 RepID=A0A6I6DXE7_THETI|nr:thioredoxin family protein [Thermochromatium tepidum]QGU32241.1 thioredoxin family protein [Thermochromatium tepidum ATCC 43061]